MVTGSKEMIRDINSHIVLETVLNDGPVSRASISLKTNIVQYTLIRLISKLMPGN